MLVNIRRSRDEDGVGFRLSVGIPKWAIHKVYIRLGWLVLNTDHLPTRSNFPNFSRKKSLLTQTHLPPVPMSMRKGSI